MHVHADHSHHSGPTEQSAKLRPLAVALGITATFMVLEIVGGLWTNSLALLADAGHMATDVAALVLSLLAMWLARRPATAARSFGYHRAEILAAFLNSATLVLISLYIFWEAFQRIGAPPEIDSGPMLAVAVAGLLANAASAWVLARGGGHEHNLNTRGAFLHVISDMLGSVGAIVAALVMWATGWYLADPILSAGIGLLILRSSWHLLSESLNVLMEATPTHIDTEEVRMAVSAVKGVEGLHDLHVWTVTSGLVAMSGHIEIGKNRPWSEILVETSGLLRERFGIAHVTLQPEEPHDLPEAFRGCSLDSPEGLAACRVPSHGKVVAHQGHYH